jgi:hypothetical protein
LKEEKDKRLDEKLEFDLRIKSVEKSIENGKFALRMKEMRFQTI